jgi:hypothetical protein
MPNLRNYFCSKIKEISKLDIYEDYKKELNRLNNDHEYNALIKKIDSLSGDEYRELKLEIKKHEQQLLVYEKALNKYIDHITKQYNNLLEKPNSGKSCQRR